MTHNQEEELCAQRSQAESRRTGLAGFPALSLLALDYSHLFQYGYTQLSILLGAHA